MENISTDSPSLSKILDSTLETFNHIDSSDLPTNSEKFQDMVKSTISDLEKITLGVSHLGLFSENETLDELSTESIKFLLLPVLLGSLTLKRMDESREELCRKASIYFKDFAKRCKSYAITKIDLPFDEFSDDSIKDNFTSGNKMITPQELQAQAKLRESKIQRYKEKQTLEKKLKVLKDILEKRKNEEEFKRKYYITMIERFVYITVDELQSIAMERQMLKSIGHMKVQDSNLGDQPKPKREGFKPFLITKDDIQKHVFGAGYPSLPVMTLDEFYEKRVKEGWFPTPESNVDLKSGLAGGDADNEASQDEAAEKEQREDNDDQNQLDRLRERDEWRDTHRTGWGNTYNRS